MLKLIDNFSYKYIDTKYVFCITNPIKPKLFNTSFFSVPYISQNNKIKTNVLIAYNKKDTCDYQVNKLNKYCDKDKDNISSFQIDLQEFKYIGGVMNIPIVVIIDDKSLHYNIYYHYKQKNDILILK